MLLKGHLKSKVTPNKTRSSDSFSTVTPIVINGGDWGFIVRDLENIIVLVFLAFNFIPHHHALSRRSIKYAHHVPLKNIHTVNAFPAFGSISTVKKRETIIAPML